MIEVTTRKEPKEIKDFPKLMKGKRTGMIVLMISVTNGTVIDPNGSTAEFGEIFDRFDIKELEDYNEELTIKNK